jgi:hypothetical protein
VLFYYSYKVKMSFSYTGNQLLGKNCYSTSSHFSFYGPRAPLRIEEGSKDGDRGTMPFSLGIRGRERQGIKIK